MPTVVITGAEQGLGLELARAYAAGGYDVLAGCLKPDATGIQTLAKEQSSVTVVPLDVTKEGSVAALADRFSDRPVDVLINNAGVHFRKWSVPEKVSFADWELTLQVNTLGPAKVSFALRDSLARAGTAKLVTISSDWGSVSNHPGTAYDYCSSKAAVNSVMRGLAMNWVKQGISVLMIHPGWMQTTMGGVGAPTAPSESAQLIKSIIDRATLADNGRYIDTTGTDMPW
ncbi:MAG: SDR family oxidoreductase [Alphaproteobacteria bacterium]|nr:SDR family oxidoreductase [Alphaproteobacteria bacterium]MBU1559622.1 SDR family oxidoreductase [Alphaproteobacteria bacterium]MBU2304379.1 SDR family oxidoreductase [Alphaproteobacteria bacterium]MBU2367164.1 SDR family oxidoreductase [Alphaproteobacteria bacterium]